MADIVPGLYRSREGNGAIVTSCIDWGKKKKPFTDSETAKECMLESNEEAKTDEEKTKKRYSNISYLKKSNI